MQAHFGNYNPSSFGWVNDGEGIVPFNYDGVEFPAGVHHLAAPIFKRILDELIPHLPNGLMSPGCWGLDAASKNVGGGASFHTYGLAIDVNAPVNPMVDSGSYPHEMPDIAGDIARKYGCEWGGNWSSPVDYMHIELHLSPDDAAGMAASFGSDQEADVLSDLQNTWLSEVRHDVVATIAPNVLTTNAAVDDTRNRIVALTAEVEAVKALLEKVAEKVAA